MPGEEVSSRNERLDEKWCLSLFEDNPLPMWICDSKTLQFLAVNDAAVRKYGYSRDEFLRMTVRDVSPDPELPKLEKYLLQPQGDHRQSEVWIHQSRSGIRLSVEIASHTVEYMGRSAVFVTVNDVTVRQKLQEGLRTGEERLQSLFDNAAVGIYRSTREGRLIACNAAGVRMLGFDSMKELVEINLETTKVGPIYSRKEFCDRVDRDNIVIGLESTWIRKDGAAIKVRESASVVRDHDGKPLYYDGTLEDITEQKRAEEAVKLAEAVIDRATVGIFVIGPDGSIKSVNLHASRTLGYTREELQAMTVFDIDPGMSAEKWNRHRALVAKEMVKRFETMHRRKDGTTLPVEVMVNLLEFDDKGYSVTFSRDITEQKEAEKANKTAEIALEESERRFRELFDDAPVGYHELDSEGRIVRVNRTELNMLGYGAEDMLGHYVWEFVKDHDMSEANVMKKLSGDLPAGKSYERAYCRKDGSVIHFLVEEYYLYDVSHKIVGIRTALEDITERKKAEDALRAAEEHFRNLFENITIGVYRTSPDGRILFVNPALARMLGYESPDELAKTNVEEDSFEGGHTRSAFKAKIEKDGQVIGMETRWRKKDGSFLWVRENARVVRDSKGEPLCYEGTAEDVDFRKKMEEALRKSEEQYRSFFEEDPTADSLTLPDGEIIACNPGFLKMFGFKSEEEALSTNVIELYAKKETRTELIGLVRRKKKLTEHELELRNRDGKPVYVRATYVGVFDEHGELVRIKQYLLDETEQKSLERQLFQSQKLEGIGRLAGGVAHDYNNILGVILGYGELVKNKLNETDPIYHQIEAVLKAAYRGSELTRQLLAFARREIVSPKVLNLGSAVESIRPMIQRLIGENINLVLNATQDLWNTKIDPTQFDQILINLATNSRDAIEDIGTITIEVYNEKIDEHYVTGHREFSPGEYVVLSVTDDGKGMDSDVQDKMFEPFFTTKPKGEGTGLGLSTVYGIVKQNGGNVNVYSEPGKGTVIRVYFPRSYGRKEISEEKPQDESFDGSETVLVVEDQPDLLELAKNSLEEYRYKVLAAYTPAEAIDICETYGDEIDLLLSDVIMPKMNGKELRDKIAKLKPRIKTLFMSGYTANVIAHRGILDEGIHFIQKPFTPKTLAKKVREVLQLR